MNALPTTDALYPTVTFAATLGILCLLSCFMVLTQILPFTPLEIPFQQQYLFGTYLVYSLELNLDVLINYFLSGCSKQAFRSHILRSQLLTSFWIPHRPPSENQHLLISFSVILLFQWFLLWGQYGLFFHQTSYYTGALTSKPKTIYHVIGGTETKTCPSLLYTIDNIWFRNKPSQIQS